MALQLTQLRIPSLTTDYSAETNAAGALGKTIAGMPSEWRKQAEAEQKRQLFATAAQGGDLNKIGLALLGAGDVRGGAALLGLGQKAEERKAEAAWYAGIGGGGAPAAPAGAPLAALGNPNEIESRFVNTVKGAGLTNPVGLGAVAAYGKAESGFAPQNVNRSWSDPSESGQPGTAGGIMSWRAERLQNLQKFAQQRGESQPSVETQALFLSQEDPTLIPKLQSAQTPQEANQIMANAWRFAGYNRPGGENARREALTTQYAQRYGGQGGPAPAIPVQVAQNEADVQRLEAQQGNPVIDAPGPVQVAQAPGPQAAQGFSVPGATPQQSQSILADPQVQLWSQRFGTAPTEKARAYAKQRLDLAVADAKTRVDEGGPLTREGRWLANEKLRRDLQGEQPIPLTPEERQKFGIRPDQAAYKTRDGIKFGPAGTTIVNEAQKLQGAEDKARVDVNTKFLGKLADSGPQVSQRMADMDVLAAVIRDAPPGPTADVQVFFDRLGAGLGFSKGELATRSDAMKAIVQRLAPAQREEGSGSTSDIEFKGMLASFPSLAATGEGRQMILTTIARQNEITRMRVEVADQWTQGEIPATEARKRIAQIDRASIYASEDEKKLIRKLAGTARGGDLGKASPAMTREVGGKLYEQRGGQWYAKEAN